MPPPPSRGSFPRSWRAGSSLRRPFVGLSVVARPREDEPEASRGQVLPTRGSGEKGSVSFGRKGETWRRDTCTEELRFMGEQRPHFFFSISICCTSSRSIAP